MTWTDFNINWHRCFAEKWQRLDKRLESDDIDVLIVQDLPNVRYLTGYSAYLAIATLHDQLAVYIKGGRRPYLLPPRYYADFARKNFPWNDVHEMPSGEWLVWLSTKLADARCIGYAGLTYEFGRALAKSLEQVTLVDCAQALAELRAVKTSDEIEILRRASVIAEAGMAAGIAACRVGAHETDVSAEAERVMRALGAESHSIVMRGVNASILQELSSTAILGNTDLVLLDLGCWWQGYRAEFARTVVVGDPTPSQRGAFLAVYEALMAAQDKVSPGSQFGDVVSAAQAVLDQAGFAAYPLNHPMGHGIGVVGSEYPVVKATSTVELTPNMVINLEPGLFIPEEAIGIRLENMLLVTETGCEILTLTPFDRVLLA